MKYSDSSASLHFPLCPLGGVPSTSFLSLPFVMQYRLTPHVSRLHRQGREQVRKKAPFILALMYNKDIKELKSTVKREKGKIGVCI